MAGRGSSLPSIMSHDFSTIPGPPLQRSVFGRPYTHKTTFDADYLIPIYVDDILPGDTVSMDMTAMARLSTMIFPIMDNIFLDFFFFFVPNRLVWSNWEKFQGAQVDPGDPTDYEIPFVPPPAPNGSTGFQLGSIYDYMGLPLDVDIIDADAPSALPFRMYNLIWNEWFRDQNLQDSVGVEMGDGPDDANTYVLLKRGKKHDYFTSCLPEPQKGDAVPLPVGSTAPVYGTGKTLGLYDGSIQYGISVANGSADMKVLAGAAFGEAIGGAPVGTTPVVSKVIGVRTGPLVDPTDSGLVADLANAVGPTVNQLREIVAIQQMLERDQRSGTRYTEALKGRWGVDAGDARLQRPEYLGGASKHINVSAIAQTTPNAAPTNINALGNLAAYSHVEGKVRFQKSFVEHGYIIGLANVRADITYHQGIARHWTKRTRFELYEPAMAHLGEQAVLNREIYYANGGTDSDGVFGYQERWDEYRYKPSNVTNLMRPGVTGSLAAWNLAQNFSSQPALDSAFIVSNAGALIDRVIAVSTQPQVIFDSFFDVKHARLMPRYSVPGLDRL